MTDFAKGLWVLNPAYQYRLSSSVPPHRIIEWFGPGKEPPTERDIIDASVQYPPDARSLREEVDLLKQDKEFTE